MMADVAALHGTMKTKRKDEDFKYHQGEHHEVLPAEAPTHDFEKHDPERADHALNQSRTDDTEYVVTAKTWAVVVVSFSSIQ